MRVAKERRLKRKARKARQRRRFRAAFEAALADRDDPAGGGALFVHWLKARPWLEGSWDDLPKQEDE